MDDRCWMTCAPYFEWRNRLILLLLIILQTPAFAQIRTGARVPFSSLQAADYVAVTYIPPHPVDGEKQRDPLAATFDVRFSETFPEAAREAFSYATDVWGRYLNSSEPIVVEAEWKALDEGTLGSAGPLLVGNFPGVDFRNVWHPASLANSIARDDLSPTRPDIFASFNSDFPSWYFGIDGQVPSDKYDFVTVILHELGHGLGFSGSFDVDDGDPSNRDECPDVGAGWGCWGIAAERGGDVFPLIFDLFTEDDNEVSLLVESVYPNPSTELAAVLTSGAVFFDGDFSTPINDGVPIDLFAPTNFDAGSSLSHLDESRFATPPGKSADPDALMTPFLARGEAIHNPGLITCAIFEDFGWEMGDGCIALLASSTDLPDALPPDVPEQVSEFYPNPSAGAATALIHLTMPQPVVVEAFDASGRRVASRQQQVHSGANEISLNVSSWASGVYFVRIRGETFHVMKSLVASGR